MEFDQSKMTLLRGPGELNRLRRQRTTFLRLLPDPTDNLAFWKRFYKNLMARAKHEYLIDYASLEKTEPMERRLDILIFEIYKETHREWKP